MGALSLKAPRSAPWLSPRWGGGEGERGRDLCGVDPGDPFFEFGPWGIAKSELSGSFGRDGWVHLGLGAPPAALREFCQVS